MHFSNGVLQMSSSFVQSFESGVNFDDTMVKEISRNNQISSRLIAIFVINNY